MTDTHVKAAIVTGASGGIGRAVSLRLAGDGFAVVVNYAGNAAKADEAVTEIKTAGGRAIAIQADVAHAAGVKHLFRDTLGTFGELRRHHAAGADRRWQSGSLRQGDRHQSARRLYPDGPGGQACLGGRAHHRGLQRTADGGAPRPAATELFLKGKNEAQVEQFGKLAPLEPLGRPEDIADVVSFLAGPDGGWVNAQVLRANGGFA